MGGGSDEREIGDQAVWSLSTAKPGNGVEQLRDDNSDTYWQCAHTHNAPHALHRTATHRAARTTHRDAPHRTAPHARRAHEAPSRTCPGRTVRSRT